MSILPAGSYALIKHDETDDGEVFMILWVDPDKAGKPGHMWVDFGPMTEAQALHQLSDMKVSEDKVQGLFERARADFSEKRR